MLSPTAKMTETIDRNTDMFALEIQIIEVDALLGEIRSNGHRPRPREITDNIVALLLMKSEIQRRMTANSNPQNETPIEETNLECVACNESFNPQEMMIPACGHGYCHKCAIEVVKSSLTDINMFPPRCCDEPFDIETQWLFMDRTLWAQLERRKAEHDDPSPTYCWKPNCANLLSPEDKDDSVGKCPKCHKETCVKCKEKMHQGPCVGGTHDYANMLALIEEKGWKRCPSCGQGIERSIGCPHMQCDDVLHILSLIHI